MQAMNIQSLGDSIVITIKKELIAYETFIKLFERLRIEELIGKAEFKNEVIDLADQIKKEWWQNNQDSYLRASK